MTGGYRPRIGSPFSGEHPLLTSVLMDSSASVGLLVGQTIADATWSDPLSSSFPLEVVTVGAEDCIAGDTRNGDHNAVAVFTERQTDADLRVRATPLLTGTGQKQLGLTLLTPSLQTFAGVSITLPPHTPYNGIASVEILDSGNNTAATGTLHLAGNTFTEIRLRANEGTITLDIGTFTLQGANIPGPTSVANLQVDINSGPPLGVAWEVSTITLTARRS